MADKFEFIVGRQPTPSGSETSILVTAAEDPNEFVSRNHCRIIVENGEISVEDLGSTNKTFVNGIQLDKNEVKKVDDDRGMIRLGSKYYFTLQHPAIQKALKAGGIE